MATLLGRTDLLSHPDFLTREDRKANRHQLRAELETVLKTRSSSEWLRELNAKGVPSGPVLSVPQVLEDPQISGRGLISTVPMAGEDLQLSGSPVIVDGKRPSPQTAPPGLGADNDEIWSALGLSQAEINKLKEKGVI